MGDAHSAATETAECPFFHAVGLENLERLLLSEEVEE
jgi:hypothetical protein